MVPRNFSFLVKKTKVLFGPIMAVIPHKKRTYLMVNCVVPSFCLFIFTLPIAIKPPSNNINTPIIMKNKPNAVKPTPISTDTT